MDVGYSIVLGAVQGVAEFLPISSSGHLVVVSYLYSGKTLPLELNIGLHMGTLLAVFAFFWRDWWQLIQGVIADVVRKEKNFHSRVLLPALVLGSVPAGFVGLMWQDVIEVMFHHPSFVAWPLMIVGILIWVGDKFGEQVKTVDSMSIKDGVIVGFAQALALIPGVSRSGITILGGRLLGFRREDAARFGFLLGAPAMLGAALLNLGELAVSVDDPQFLLGFLSSAVVGCLTIQFFLQFIKKFGFGVFALYRVALGGIILWLMAS